MKAEKRVLKIDKEPYKILRKVQDVVPIKRIWEDGIFLAGNRYCKSFRFYDINYIVASQQAQMAMLR